MAYEAIPYEPSLQPEWDAIVRSARARHFLFERAYMDYHADRFVDGSLLLVRDGKAAVALPGSRHGNELVSHGGLTFGALLSDASFTAAQTIEAMDCVIAHLRAVGVRRWTYKPLPHMYHVAPAEEDLFALGVHGATLGLRDVSAAVPCGRPVAMSTERRRAVTRGRRTAVEIGRSDAFEEFMELERAILHDRHDAEPAHTPAEMRLLADRFPDEISLHAARADGELVAGVVVYETPVVAHAQYIAASDRGRELRAGDALFDHLLTDVYADKRWFDFGISSARDGRLNEGLMRNKEGFGARAVVYDRYVLSLD